MVIKETQMQEKNKRNELSITYTNGIKVLILNYCTNSTNTFVQRTLTEILK